MANEPYNPVPNVLPQGQAPADTLRINATPAAFGGELAQGTENLGQGAVKAGQFFGQVAADQASNNFQQQASQIVTNYKSLRGQAAIEARPKVEQQLDDLLTNTRNTLTTPAQNLQFDSFSRRYRSYLDTDIGAHYDQQTQVWGIGVQDGTIKGGLGDIASDPYNEAHVANSTKDVIHAYVQKARFMGLPEDAAMAEGKQAAVATRVEAIGARDPKAALQMADKYKQFLGEQYPALVEKLSRASNAQSGAMAGDAHLNAALNAQPKAVSVSAPVFTQITSAIPGGYSPQGLAETIHIESGGNPNAGALTAHKGLGQFSSATWAQFGRGSPLDPEQSLLATQRYAAANAPLLQQALGREPTDGELYLAHQQGPAAAIKLLTNPNVRAGDLVGDAAIRQNGGDPNAPASAFVQKWTARFTGPGGAVTPFGGRTLTLPINAGVAAPIEAFTASAAPSAGALAPQLTTPSTPPVAAPVADQTSAPQAPTNPYDAAEVSAMADTSLNYQQKIAARAQIRWRQQVAQADAIDQERQLRLAKEQREEASDHEERKVMADLYSAHPVNTVQSIVNNPLLTNAAVDRMIKIAQLPERAQPSAGVSHDNTLKLLDAMRRPEGDPQRIEGMQPLYDALIDHQINKSDFDWLSKQQEDIKTPEGQRISAAQSQFIKLYSPTITRSNSLMGNTDPAGDQRLYQFEQDIDAAVQRYKAEGKNPLDLFNPAKPDFVGTAKAIAPYQTSMTETMNAKVAGAISPQVVLPPVTTPLGITGPGAPTQPVQQAPASTPADERPRRLPNETFADYDRRVTDFLAKRAAASKVGHLVIGAAP